MTVTLPGAYLVLFSFYLHILRTRSLATKHHFLTGSTVCLFILCSAHCALEVATTILRSETEKVSTTPAVPTSSRDVWISLMFATNAIYVTSNVIADSIFIFRCYAIWNFQGKIIIFPIILTLVVAGYGYSNVIIYCTAPDFFQELGLQSAVFDVSIVLSVFTTLVLVGLTVGRIWWLARAARHVMGRKVAKKYYTVCAMILESGMLYGVSDIAFVIVAAFRGPLDATMTGVILGQLVGIAPTIIAVRVGLGHSVENTDGFIAPRPHARCPPKLMRALASVEAGEVLDIR
ncbi:hypothetical protein FB451DRAFT_1215780 [Mycena latifolia]|nr:hypothetical protein FB451DRAFT_1215780 [Mycena latifolia]